MKVPIEEPLSPGQMRSFLENCAAVVKPGETLVVLVPSSMSSRQVAEYQDSIDAAVEVRGFNFKVLVLVGEALGVVKQETPEHEVAKDISKRARLTPPWWSK